MYYYLLSNYFIVLYNNFSASLQCLLLIETAAAVDDLGLLVVVALKTSAWGTGLKTSTRCLQKPPINDGTQLAVDQGHR